MTEPVAHPHLAAEELAPFIDARPPLHAGDPGAELHLAGCDECRARLTGLREEWARTASAIRLADPTPQEQRLMPAELSLAGRAPRRTDRARLLRRAAVIAVAIPVTAMAVAPVRAAVSAWIQRQWAAILPQVSAPAPGAPLAPPAAPAPAPAPGAAGAEYRFAPSSDGDALLHFRVEPRSGQIRIARGTGGLVTLRSRGPQPGDPVITVPAGLHVENSGSSTHDFDITVPDAVRQLRIQIGRRRVNIPAEMLGGGPVMVDLRGAADR